MLLLQEFDIEILDRSGAHKDVSLCAQIGQLLNLVNFGQLLNSGQLVKLSSQLWSKLQIWLNERGRIGNWTGIKLLIN